MTSKAHSDPLQRIGSENTTKGFTLTEIAIVLGIIGLILSAIWTAAAAVYANQRVSHANTAILQIVQAVRGLYATSPGNAGLTTDSLMCARATPSDLTNVAPCAGVGTMIDMWPGGATTILPTTNDTGGFAIEMTLVPQAACISLVLAIAGQNRDPGLFYVGVAALPVAGVGSTLTPVTDGAALTGTPTPVTAATSCANPTNTFAVGFSLKS